VIRLVDDRIAAWPNKLCIFIVVRSSRVQRISNGDWRPVDLRIRKPQENGRHSNVPMGRSRVIASSLRPSRRIFAYQIRRFSNFRSCRGILSANTHWTPSRLSDLRNIRINCSPSLRAMVPEISFYNRLSPTRARYLLIAEVEWRPGWTKFEYARLTLGIRTRVRWTDVTFNVREQNVSNGRDVVRVSFRLGPDVQIAPRWTTDNKASSVTVKRFAHRVRRSVRRFYFYALSPTDKSRRFRYANRAHRKQTRGR